MQEIECALCGVKYEIEENSSDLTCMICDTVIVENHHIINKICEASEMDDSCKNLDLDDFSDFDEDFDLNDLPDITDIADFDDVEDLDKFGNYDEDEEETTLLKELKEDDFIVEKWGGESYSKMIKNYAINPLDINSHKFNYIPSKPRNIFSKVLIFTIKSH